VNPQISSSPVRPVNDGPVFGFLTSAKISLCKRICDFILARVITAIMRRLPTIRPWPQASRIRASASVGFEM
jgi:hypothetical protein